MKNAITLIAFLFLSALSVSAQSCYHFSNGMSSYQTISGDGTYVYFLVYFDGADSMTASPPCVVPPGVRHTASTFITVTSNSGVQTTGYNSYFDCGTCYLSETAEVVATLGNDTSWDFNWTNEVLCSSAGFIYNVVSDKLVGAHTTNWKQNNNWNGSTCTGYLSCPNGNQNAFCGQTPNRQQWVGHTASDCSYAWAWDWNLSWGQSCFGIGKAGVSQVAKNCD
jgi:hypothetical protein